MRTTLLGSLLDVAQRNLARGAERVALFESGRVYLPISPSGRTVVETGNRGFGVLAGAFPGERAAPDREPHRIGCLAVGPARRQAPGAAGGEPADFFALKGVLEGACRAARRRARLRAGGGAVPAPGPLRPGRAGGRGRGLDRRAAPARLPGLGPRGGGRLRSRPGGARRRRPAGEEAFEDVTTFPAVYQDIAVVVPAEVPAAEVRDAVLAGGGELLRAAEVFDLYEGEQLGEGRKSLALRLEFRAADRTLTDEEVAARRAAIEAELEKIGGSLRG